MNLPDYFIADLPSGATLTPSMIREACLTLKRNRQAYLRDLPTPRLLRRLTELGENWLQEDYPFRRLALEKCPESSGFQAPTLRRGLDAFFCELQSDRLKALMAQDLGHHQRLDGFCATAGEVEGRRSAIVTGPDMLVHLTAGNVPSPALMSLVLGLLTRSAQFVKCATGTSLLPRLFAHSLHEIEPKLASCIEIAEWPGGTLDLETPLFAEADCVTATGSDETLAEVQGRLPTTTRFLGYGHRVSFAYVTRDALHASHLSKVTAAAADDVTAWNQLGCLSPHVLYVETGGGITPQQFAAEMAAELERRESVEPRGPVPPEVAAIIAWRRGFYEVRAAHSEKTRLWCSKQSTAWTVVCEEDPLFTLSCLHRFIHVKAVTDLTQTLHAADAVHGQVSTVGLAAYEDRVPALALQLSRWGASRICPLGRMQKPPLTWRHDGHPSLAALVRWTDLEQ
jgi:hypothetical protein